MYGGMLHWSLLLQVYGANNMGLGSGPHLLSYSHQGGVVVMGFATCRLCRAITRGQGSCRLPDGNNMLIRYKDRPAWTLGQSSMRDALCSGSCVTAAPSWFPGCKTQRSPTHSIP